MPNEFIARNGITSLGNVIVSGSLTTTGAVTISGSIASASFATNASTASSADNLLVRNTLTAQTLVVQTITSSVDFVTGSTRFGSVIGNTHQFTGSVSITGSLALAGNITSNGTAVVLGSGSTNYLPKFTGSSTIGDSLVYDNGTNVGIATNNPVNGKLDVRGDAGSFAGYFLGGNTTSTSFGVGISAGTNSTDFALLVRNRAETSTLLQVMGSGNVGIGVTPSAWSQFTALQLGGNTYSAIASSNNYIIVSANTVYDGSDFKYITTGAASRYQQSGGGHEWHTAPSGTAGNAISFTQAMTLNASGNLSIGNTNDTFKLDVSGTGRFRGNAIGDIPLVITHAWGGSSTALISANNASAEVFKVDRNGAATFSSSVTAYGPANDWGLSIWGSTTTGQSYGGIVRGGTNSSDVAFRVNNAANNTTFLTVQGNGNVGIGTTSPNLIGASVGLSINNATDAVLELNRGNSRAGFLYSDATRTILAEYRNLPLIFYTNDTERMRISATGFLKLSNNGTYAGATDPNHEIRSNNAAWGIVGFTHSASSNPYGISIAFPNVSPNNTTNWFIYASDSTEGKFAVFSNGDVDSRTNSYSGWSDIKLKENIIDTTPKLDDLLKVKIKNFNFKNDTKKQLGVIAQELEEIFPAMVYETPDIITDNETGKKIDLGTTTKSVRYSVFVPMLIKAIQELTARVQELENK
jgi:hypothetical protein